MWTWSDVRSFLSGSASASSSGCKARPQGRFELSESWTSRVTTSGQDDPSSTLVSSLATDSLGFLNPLC